MTFLHLFTVTFPSFILLSLSLSLPSLILLYSSFFFRRGFSLFLQLFSTHTLLIFSTFPPIFPVRFPTHFSRTHSHKTKALLSIFLVLFRRTLPEQLPAVCSHSFSRKIVVVVVATILSIFPLLLWKIVLHPTSDLLRGLTELLLLLLLLV